MTQERKSLIRRFFGGLWALLTWLRTSLANLFFLLFIAIAIVMFSADRGAGTVSYTHLRAHETVLDLVCRLLLETTSYALTILILLLIIH